MAVIYRCELSAICAHRLLERDLVRGRLEVVLVEGHPLRR